MKNKKILLYIFFSLVIVTSLVVFILDYNNKDSEQKLIDEPTPSQIEVSEKEKQNVVVESGTSIKMAPDVDLDAERKKYNNNDIIGRLEIPDLFNVLVVHSTDPKNQYYLSHDLSKKYDIRGSEFLDYNSTPTGKQVNIYGHNTRDPRRFNVAFLKLEKFLEQDFFNENQYIIFQYDGGKSIYKIKAMREIYENNLEHLHTEYTGSQFVEHVNKMTGDDGLIYRRDIEVNENSEILVLQTCSHHWDKALYIITAVKIS